MPITLSSDDMGTEKKDRHMNPNDNDFAASENSDDCKALLDSAHLELFTINAFRATGLATNASGKEIAKQSGKLKLMQELGGGLESNGNRASLDEIRSALHRLKDPQLRLVDELFWFWPEVGIDAKEDKALVAATNHSRPIAEEIWKEREQEGTSIVATHNLAVLGLLDALDLESDLVIGDPISESVHSTKSMAYWKNGLSRWKLLYDSNETWKYLSDRITALNEAGVSYEYSLQLRANLPKALSKIIANQIEKSFLAGNKQGAAKFLEVFTESSDSILEHEHVARYTLESHNKRVARATSDAKRYADDASESGRLAIVALVANTTNLAELAQLFLEGSDTSYELIDEAVHVAINHAVECQKKSDDDEEFVRMLARLSQLPVSRRVKERLDKLIAVGKANIGLAQATPVINKIKAILSENVNPATKWDKLKGMLPEATAFKDKLTTSSDAANAVTNFMAYAARTISVAAYNSDTAQDTAFEAIDFALKSTRDPEDKVRFKDDHAKVVEGLTKFAVTLDIRGDFVAIDHRRVKYKDWEETVSNINGFRYGVFEQFTNGIRTSVSYMIGISGKTKGVVQIECKRIFRDEAQAESDYRAIISAMYNYAVPHICETIANQISAGQKVPLGAWQMSATGIQGTTGALFWEKTHNIPWSSVSFRYARGHLIVGSSYDPKLSLEFSVREVWNAIIFEQIMKAVVARTNRPRS